MGKIWDNSGNIVPEDVSTIRGIDSTARVRLHASCKAFFNVSLHVDHRILKNRKFKSQIPLG